MRRGIHAPRQGFLRRIEQLRRELEATGKLTNHGAEDPGPEPIWRSSTKPETARIEMGIVAIEGTLMSTQGPQSRPPKGPKRVTSGC
jgi:hypothetical protein